MTRHPHAPHTFASKPNATFEEMRDGDHWLLAMHKQLDGRPYTKLICFSEWHAQTALVMLGNWAADKTMPHFNWDDCCILSERIRYRISMKGLNVAINAASRDVGCLEFLRRCGYAVGKELDCELRRLELLRECVRAVECRR